MINVLFLLILLYFLYKCSCGKREMFESSQGKITMYGRQSCGYTRKMIEELQKTNTKKHFHYIDTSTKKGSQLFERIGGNGVPHFVYKNKSATGFMPANELMKKLNFFN